MDPLPIQLDESAIKSMLARAGVDYWYGKNCRCPFHDDKHPSAGIFVGDDKIIRFKCLACGIFGDVFDIQSRVEHRPVVDLIREYKKSTMPGDAPPRLFDSIEAITATIPGKLEGLYKYTNPDTGNIDLAVWRYIPRAGEKKCFCQASPRDGKWAKCGIRINPLYNRTRVRQSDKIVVVEGEKKVHALYKVGITATTAPGGANSVEKADWTPLAGKEVWLWPDNDSTGIAAMDRVKSILESLDNKPKLYMINPSTLGLTEKGDVVDFLDTLSDCSVEAQRAAIEDVLADAMPATPASEVEKLVEDTISGVRRNIPYPWTCLTKLAKAMYPKTVTALCGDPGSKKSFMLLEAMLHWHQIGVKVALYELEEDRAYHLHRALAVLAGNAEMTNDEWVRNHPDECRAALVEHKATLDSFGSRIDDAPDAQKTLADLTEWVRYKAESGCEIIGIDPVTAAATEQRPWEADLKFVMDIKTIARKHGCRVIIVLHPKKNRTGKPNISEMAGGTAYERFPQTVLWITGMHPPEQIVAENASGTVHAEANTLLHIGKARNGHGSGLRIGYTFRKDTLSFQEHGVLVDD